MDEETKRYIGFSIFPGIGPVRFKLLLQYFKSASAAWHAPVSEFETIHMPAKLTAEFDHFRKTYDLDGYITQLGKLHVSVLPITNPKYPPLLKQISDAPFLLYVRGQKGDHPVNLHRTIAVVGTRQITPYGKDMTRRITEGLVAYGFTIVSGLAYGVDAVAHRSAIGAGGKTIAVLGCGIDIIAPPSNEKLYYDIINGNGAVISEMPLGLRPSKGLFPARNRIISGLSLGVVVTEGAFDSGALITARNAGEQGREVFAVPGPVTSPYSKGPSRLLRNGATLVETADDVVEALGLEIRKGMKKSGSEKEQYMAQTKEEKAIFDLVQQNGQMHIDEVVRLTGLTIQVVGATLTVLEMKGIVRDNGENLYGLLV
jgi:DNA processing protein